ncbi:M28 family peptidase [Chitinophaga lutea]
MRWTFFFALALTACQPTSRQGAESSAREPQSGPPPAFSAANAYAAITRQVGFGPRVPGTEAQRRCAAWLQDTLRKLADTVYIQETKVRVTPQLQVPCINIIAAFQPLAQRRILLVAHWDTRPTADKDGKTPDAPMDGADDGASGVAVLLETARLLHAQKPAYGIDILLNDAEDYAQDYCLGTRYWSKNPHVRRYRAAYGIVLDMVGSANTMFFMEGTSRQHASGPMKLFWDVAASSGYSQYFSYAEPLGGTSYIEDDHTYINEVAGIPTFDIIGMQPNGSLMPHHHTTADNLSVIDKQTLQAVGQTLVNLLYGQPFKF